MKVEHLCLQSTFRNPRRIDRDALAQVRLQLEVGATSHKHGAAVDSSWTGRGRDGGSSANTTALKACQTEGHPRAGPPLLRLHRPPSHPRAGPNPHPTPESRAPSPIYLPTPPDPRKGRLNRPLPESKVFYQQIFPTFQALLVRWMIISFCFCVWERKWKDS